MKRLLSVLVCSFFALSSCIAFADNLKMGIVDMNAIFQKAPLMNKINSDLTSQFKPRQDEINAANNALQQEMNSLNTLSLSNNDRTKLQNKIINDKAKLAVLSANFERDITIAKNNALQTFSQKLSDVIAKFAKDGKYDVIQQNTNLLFVNSALDVTQQILDQLK